LEEINDGRLATPAPLDAAPFEAIAGQLRAGGVIAPTLGPPKTKSKLPTFESAAYVAVAINLARLPADAVLASPYTHRYCSVTAFPAGGGDVGEAVLVFCLPTIETDASRYALLQAGIEARYHGALPSVRATHAYYAGRQCQVSAPGRVLDSAAVRELIQLGREAKETRRQPDDLLRSRIALDSDLVVRTADGEDTVLGDLHPGVRVFCLVHADREAKALSYRLPDGRPMLACIHCQHTYTVRNADNDYDFDFFERTIRALAEDEACTRADRENAAGLAPQFDVRNERYLGQLALVPGVLCVKSPKGTGKTEQLARLVQQCRMAKKRVLLIGHRRTLLTTMATRLGLRCYLVPESKDAARREREAAKLDALLDFDDSEAEDDLQPAEGSDGGGLKRAKPTARYAISLDSMMVLRPDANKYHVVIIDEAEQVFSHLVGSTLREKRQEVYHRLRHYLRMAESVMLLDADLGMVTMDSLFAMRLMDDASMSFILNDYRRRDDIIWMYDSQGQLVARLREAVAAGEKCYVATNSKNKAIELQKALEKDWPGRRIVAVHANNSSSTEVQHLLSNIASEFERNVDVLIASPALGTGVDITFKGAHPGQDARTVVQHVFGLFLGGINTHLDIDQQLMRVRHPGAVHVWIDPIENYFETDVGVIRDQLAVTVGEARTLLGYTDDGKPILAAEDGLIDIWSRVRAANRGSKNRLATLFRKLRADAGWRIEDVPREGEAAKAGSESMKEGKELRLEEREARILAAPVLDVQTAEKLKWRHKQNLPMTSAEQAALERHWLEAFYCEPVSVELIDLDCDGRLRSAVDNLECLLAKDLTNSEFDKSQREHKVWAADLGVRCARASLLRDVLQAAGLYEADAGDIQDGAEVEQASLGPFVLALHKRKQQFESVFDLLPRKDADTKRVQQLGSVLDKVGLRLGPAKESDVGGKKVRRYQLDTARLERLRAILRQRAARATVVADGDAGGAQDVGIDADTMRRIKTSLEKSLASIRQFAGGNGKAEVSTT